MSEPADVAAEYTFGDTVNILAVFEAVTIEYLDVDAKRLIAIYTGAVIQIEAVEGSLTRTTAIKCAVYDTPPNMNEDPETASSLLDQLLDRVASALETDYERTTGER